MLKRLLLPLTLLSMALIAAPIQAAPKVGKAAPDFSLVDTYGKTRQLSEFRGKYVVLEWTNHQCPFVRKHYRSGNMQAQQKAAAEKDVVWLSIISSAPGKEGYVEADEANRLTEERGAAPAAVLLDPKGDVGRLYRAKTTPQMFIVDPQGTLKYMGGIDSIRSANPADIPKSQQYVSLALNELFAGNAVSQAVTRPYGCTVKY